MLIFADARREAMPVYAFSIRLLPRGGGAAAFFEM